MKNYEILDVLGSGTSGIVKLCYSKIKQQKFVMKTIPLAISMEKEIEILGQVDFQNIVTLEESFKEDNNMNIVMEYCPGGDLEKLLKEKKKKEEFLSEIEAMEWFMQIALAVQHCHQKKILHRDMKTSNILIGTNGVLKLSDFGISRTLEQTGSLATTAVGTPYSAPPELCRSMPYSYASDIWGLGCIYFEILALHRPFTGTGLLSLMNDILYKPVPELPGFYSEKLKEIVIKMLEKDSSSRPTIENVIKSLKDCSTDSTVHHCPKLSIRPTSPTEEVGGPSTPSNRFIQNSSSTSDGTVFKNAVASPLSSSIASKGFSGLTPKKLNAMAITNRMVLPSRNDIVGSTDASNLVPVSPLSSTSYTGHEKFDSKNCSPLISPLSNKKAFVEFPHFPLSNAHVIDTNEVIKNSQKSSTRILNDKLVVTPPAKITPVVSSQRTPNISSHKSSPINLTNVNGTPTSHSQKSVMLPSISSITPTSRPSSVTPTSRPSVNADFKVILSPKSGSNFPRFSFEQSRPNSIISSSNNRLNMSDLSIATSHLDHRGAHPLNPSVANQQKSNLFDGDDELKAFELEHQNFMRKTLQK